MKIKYLNPEIKIETLVKTDLLCDSENSYVTSSSLNKLMGSKSILEMIADGSLWEDDK